MLADFRCVVVVVVISGHVFIVSPTIRYSRGTCFAAQFRVPVVSMTQANRIYSLRSNLGTEFTLDITHPFLPAAFTDMDVIANYQVGTS